MIYIVIILRVDAQDLSRNGYCRQFIILNFPNFSVVIFTKFGKYYIIVPKFRKQY